MADSVTIPVWSGSAVAPDAANPAGLLREAFLAARSTSDADLKSIRTTPKAHCSRRRWFWYTNARSPSRWPTPPRRTMPLIHVNRQHISFARRIWRPSCGLSIDTSTAVSPLVVAYPGTGAPYNTASKCLDQKFAVISRRRATR